MVFLFLDPSPTHPAEPGQDQAADIIAETKRRAAAQVFVPASTIFEDVLLDKIVPDALPLASLPGQRRAQGLRGSGAQGLTGSGAQGLRGSRAQGLTGSGAQGLRGSGARARAQGLRGSGAARERLNNAIHLARPEVLP
ncbi:hypothetical protein GWK47_039067 [Chionoecetes opilio]|uniref:Uncharacterized protein n=1 Tax=Chionoecetes opilio TaxID=41210 RepID=A0A8J5D0K5_CHIOP|nr:hypothetical protein GWK47_039067 [Chionoecetes opilio]